MYEIKALKSNYFMTISSKIFKFLTATIIINQKLRKVNRISKKSGSTKIRYNTAVSRNYKQKINRRKTNY